MVKEETDGIPIGYKLSAQHIEKDIDAALHVGVDYVILDGREAIQWASGPVFTDFAEESMFNGIPLGSPWWIMRHGK